MNRRIFLIIIAVLLGCHSVAGEAEVKQKPMMKSKANSDKMPEVWMAILPADVLTHPDAEWDFVKKHIDGVKFWTQQIDDEAKTWPFQGGVDAPGAMEKLVKILNKHNIDIIIEKGCFPQPEGQGGDRMCGQSGAFDDTYARRAADAEIARLKRYEAIGGNVRFFDVDGPIRHMLHPYSGGKGFETIEQCAEAFVEYMLLVQKEYPDIEFFALSNFPNWGYRGNIAYWGEGQNWGDYYTALEAITRIASEKKAPLCGFTIDNPYDYAIGQMRPPHLKYDPKTVDWIARILDVEKYCREHGLEFNLIFNSDRGGGTSAELFCKESLAFIDLYHQRGGRPDRYILQSWYTHPTRDEIVPESSPNTFTNLIKTVIKKVKNIKE